jgi:thiaminase/transcriptional activator TenA
MAFTDQLLAEADPIWTAQRDHPFVTELADGTLDPSAFRHWLEQDYRYLLDYSRVFSLAAASADDETTMTRLAAVAHTILDDEMDLHREFADEYGLTAADLEAVEKAPTCQAYTDHLLRVAREGHLPTIAAAVYPCGQGYLDVADGMAERMGVDTPRAGRADGGTSAAELADSDNRYAPFVEKYTSDAFRESVAWMRDLVDRLADEHPGSHDRMRAAFHRSARLEHDFWEMAYTRETWATGPQQ